MTKDEHDKLTEFADRLHHHASQLNREKLQGTAYEFRDWVRKQKPTSRHPKAGPDVVIE